MSEVALQIGGRTWRVACTAGEEDRVRRLGAIVAEKIEAVGAKGMADSQSLLFAAILLADEVQESRQQMPAPRPDPAEEERASAEIAGLHGRVAELEDELERLRDREQSSADDLVRSQTEAAGLVDAIADQEAQIGQLRTELFDARKERDTARAASSPTAHQYDIDDTAAALERFAEVLEECADKLERRGNAT